MDRRDLRVSLLQGLLGAPGSREGWHAFLLHLCDALQGSAANFISHNFDADHSVTSSVALTARTDPRAVDEYQRHWAGDDPWRNAMGKEATPGTVLIGDSLIRPSQFGRTAFYNDFGRGYGIAQCMAGIIEMSPQAISNISINRPDGCRRFDTQDADLLCWLMPHLTRAIELHRRLTGAELMAAHASAVLERLPQGVVFVSRSGAVISANRAATEILRARDGLTLERGELRGSTPSITARLHAALNTAIRIGLGEVLTGETALPVPRASGRRPLSIIIAPLPSARAALAGDGAAAAAFIGDPDQIASPDADTIRILFDLTRSESALVQCLVSGMSLEQAGAHLGLRPQTLRSRLKLVFQKTNTHRQAELVRVVLTSAAGVT